MLKERVRRLVVVISTWDSIPCCPKSHQDTSVGCLLSNTHSHAYTHTTSKKGRVLTAVKSLLMAVSTSQESPVLTELGPCEMLKKRMGKRRTLGRLQELATYTRTNLVLGPKKRKNENCCYPPPTPSLPAATRPLPKAQLLLLPRSYCSSPRALGGAWAGSGSLWFP